MRKPPAKAIPLANVMQALRLPKGQHDARCRCGQRFTWIGPYTDRPPCPGCGDQPAREQLQEVQTYLDRQSKTTQ